MIEKAIAIAVQAHAGQTDKFQKPYILHPLRLMFRMASEEEMIAAALKAEGIPTSVLEAVDHLTRRKDETYEEFTRRAGAHPIARKVKLADLEDNMDIRRISQLQEKDLERLEKYHRAWLMLKK
jgi:hypothetical protein